MSQKGRRYPLKLKEAKEILRKASSRLGIDLDSFMGSASLMEVIDYEKVRVFIINGTPLLFEDETNLLPTLLFSEALNKLPRIVVDMGAVPYVCKGADVMAPGIVRIENEFKAGQIVVVSDMKYGKLLSLGEAMVDSVQARTMKKGPVARNLHYISDRFWQLLKTLGFT
jgi:PUA domain protein